MMLIKPMRLWGRSQECLVLWSMVAGVIVGSLASWLISRPPEPWLEFDGLTASYVLGEQHIVLGGSYTVNRLCNAPVIWRQEALATDGQIAQYGPVAQRPDLSIGPHYYQDELALQATITPDGWQVWVSANCTSDLPEIVVSKPAKVYIIEKKPG